MNVFYKFKYILDDVDWEELSRNKYAVYILEQFPEHISWYRLSENCNAMHLLLANPDKIYWHTLSKNTHPAAIQLLDNNINNPDICWNHLACNPSAVDLLEKHIDLLNRDLVQLVQWNPGCRDKWFYLN